MKRLVCQHFTATTPIRYCHKTATYAAPTTCTTYYTCTAHRLAESVPLSPSGSTT